MEEIMFLSIFGLNQHALDIAKDCTIHFILYWD